MKKARVHGGETYWTISSHFQCVERVEFRSYNDTARFNVGNYFSNKEDAEDALKKIKAVLNGADVIEMPKYEDELNVTTEIYHQKGYSEGEYCHEQSFSWGFQEGVDWLKSKIVKYENQN